ncbi:carboxyl-terminal processing protease [Spirochaetota bacterium]|nr:carboxyl-terminal processing protease [Spirochaetota bacterium]
MQRRTLVEKLSYMLVGGVGGVLLWFALGTHHPSGAIGSQPRTQLSSEQEAYLDLFENVFARVSRDYIDSDKVRPKLLIEAAIRGMLKGLDDPYTVFFDAKSYDRFKKNAQGHYHGIGVYIVPESTHFKVVSVIEGSSAWESGVRANDVIERVAGTVVTGKSIDEVTDLILGPEESLVKIFIRRGNKLLSFTLKRKQVIIKSVYTSILDANNLSLPAPTSSSAKANHLWGYIRIHRFAFNTADELKMALNTAKSKQVRGIIIDLRNNPGGLLTAAIDTVDLFVSEGVIVATQNRYGNDNYEYATRRVFFPKYVPIVILINKYSASASEIFAGALVDYGRAVAVGENTFGKFSVQQEFAYAQPEQIGFKMTIARYLLPSGKSYEKVGIPASLKVATPKAFNPAALKTTFSKQDTQLISALKLLANKKRYQSLLRRSVASPK